MIHLGGGGHEDAAKMAAIGERVALQHRIGGPSISGDVGRDWLARVPAGFPQDSRGDPVQISLDFQLKTPTKSSLEWTMAKQHETKRQTN